MNYSEQNNIKNISQQPSFRKKEKKKKHIGLWIFLIIIGFILCFIGIKIWRNDVATEYLNNILSDQPFKFGSTDYIDYVTENIQIPDEIEVSDGVFKKIEWKSSNQEVLNSDGIVNRPTKFNETVELTATLKHGLGKGKKTFLLTIIKSDAKNIEDIYIITEEEISSGEGQNNIEITYDEDKNIETITGDFGTTKVESIEDALAIINAYSKLLKIEELSFSAGNINTSIDGKQYICSQIYKKLPVYGKDITITTDKNNYLDSISINVARNLKVNIEKKFNDKELLSIVVKEMGKTAEITFSEEIIVEKDKKYYHAYIVFAENESEINSILIDVETKKIIAKKSLFSSAFSETVKSTGKDLLGENQTFYTSKENNSGGATYRFYNLHRNIEILDNGSPIISPKNDFSEYPDGISAYQNLSTTYDWYHSKFNRISFDGKGYPITCLIRYSKSPNNASYIYGSKRSLFSTSTYRMFVVGETTKFKYPLSAGLDVMAHEYTHAVFASIMGDEYNATVMYDTINEAYADIFGCLIDGDWNLGLGLIDDDVVFRDSTFYSDYKIHIGNDYPTKYLGKNWQNECHADSVVLSHVAYSMTQNGFSDDDIANIWYQSLFYGLDTSSDFLDVRHNVERAAKKLNYSEEQITTIGNLFAEVNIGEKEKIKIKNYSIDGDMLKDDIQKKDFLIVWSPIASMLGKSPIMIFEEDNSLTRTYSDEELSKLLSDYFNGLLNEESTSDGEYQFNIKVEYKRIPKFAIDLCKKFATDAKDTMLTQISDTTGQSEEETSNWFNIFFLVQSYEGTSYEFWTEFVGIDFSQIEWNTNE